MAVSTALLVVVAGEEIAGALLEANAVVFSSAPCSVALRALIKSLNWLDLGETAGLTDGVASS